MIDPLFHRLDVAVQHSGIRANAHPVHDTRDFQPSRSGYLVTRDKRSGSFRKNLGASPWTTPHSRVSQLFDNPFERLTGDLHEEIEFDHCECFEMDSRKAFPEAAKQIGVITEGSAGFSPPTIWNSVNESVYSCSAKRNTSSSNIV